MTPNVKERDPWIVIGELLGRRAGDEFLRRMVAAPNAETSLHVLRQRGEIIRKWVAPPENIDDEPAPGAQSRLT